MIVKPSARGDECFALCSNDFIVDCLMNFDPSEREAVLRKAIAYPDPTEGEEQIALIMAKVKERETEAAVTMVNHFDMACEMARLVDAGISGDEMVAKMRLLFPTATVADYERAKRIGLDRFEILEEERHAAARSITDQVFGGAPDQVIDTSIRLYLGDNLRPSAATLFPKPDKSKS
jgi:hypothetical protein